MANQADEKADAHATSERPSRWVKLRRGLLVMLLSLVAIEGLARVGAFVWHGANEYYLLYGFPGLGGRIGISPWSVYSGQHFKFPPHFELKGAAGQKHETAHTNNLGFRGPDFEPEKPAGTLRVVCTGGSSTFGFHNDDDETYPIQLEAMLRERFDGIEVINAGFPYYHTGCILGLLDDELLDYEPDVLTIYSAYNDASWPLELGTGMRVLFWFQEHSVVYLILKQTILTDAKVYSIKNKLRRQASQRVDEAALIDYSGRTAARYRANVEAVIERAEERGIPVVLVRQPITVQTDGPEGGERASYEEEYRIVRDKLAAGEYLSSFEFAMIRHHRLLEELDAIAAERGLPVVDNVAIVDEERSLLSSWVHLSEEGNRRLAEALKEILVPLLEARRGS